MGLRNFARRYWKSGLVLVAAGLWIVGLTDQIDSFNMTARYVGISLVMALAAAVV